MLCGPVRQRWLEKERGEEGGVEKPCREVGAGHVRPAAFPISAHLPVSAGPHMCGPYCMASQGPAQVLGLNLPAAGAMHPEGMESLPYKIISPRRNTVQRQASGANVLLQRYP